MVSWTVESQNDRTLNRIIVYALSVSFSGLLASLEALRPAPHGFVLRPSWATVLAFFAGAAVVVPCFQILVYSTRPARRRIAVALVALIAMGSFFYPLRFVPRENLISVFLGLGVAVVALSIVGSFLLMTRRFFEHS